MRQRARTVNGSTYIRITVLFADDQMKYTPRNVHSESAKGAHKRMSYLGRFLRLISQVHIYLLCSGLKIVSRQRSGTERTPYLGTVPYGKVRHLPRLLR